MKTLFRGKPFGRLDRYIIVKFLGHYFFSIALIISIAVVFDYNEHIDKFVANNAPWKAIIFDYYLNFIPYFSNLFSPLFVFIAVIFFTSKLAENSEIIAMFSTGTSIHRLMFPYMFSALLIAILTYGLGAYVIPNGNVTRLEFENVYKKKRKVENARNIQMEVETDVIAYIERFESSNNTAYRFSLDSFEGNSMKSHFTARSLVYAGDKDNPYKWKAKNWQHRIITDSIEVITSGLQMDTIVQVEPYDLFITKNQQETLTSPELKRYIDKQRRRGIANIKEFEIEYHKRIATSFAAFILTLIGLSLSVKKVKGGMGMNLGIGIALSFGYIVFQTISSTFAVNGSMSPIIAVWIPNMTFLVIGAYLYWKASK
ncbi:MAG: LptF/LptG family permease [Bacteroidaceae bacterium]|nr:LptF/LptG family permease [Bacteroidaceae bacterium]